MSETTPEDEYNALRDEMVNYRGQLPYKVREILQLRTEALSRLAEKIKNITLDVTYNLIDIGGNKILMPGVTYTPPYVPKIEYTGTLTKLTQPIAYVPSEGLDVILPPQMYIDWDAIKDSLKDIGGMTVLGYVYAISSPDAPYNGDFQNAVKKVYYSKKLLYEVPYTDEWNLVDWENFGWHAVMLYQSNSNEILAKIKEVYRGGSLKLFQLSDSEVQIFYTTGTFRLREYTTDNEIKPYIRGHLIMIQGNLNGLRVFYGKMPIDINEGVFIIETASESIVTKCVLVQHGTDEATVRSMLESKKPFFIGLLNIISPYSISIPAIAERILKTLG